MSSRQVYDFKKQLEKQKPYIERFIKWFDDYYRPESIRYANAEEEARSIDLVAELSVTKELTIEVKTDFAAAKSGNLAFEIISQARVGTESALGWGLKLGDTDLLVYIIPGQLREPDKLWMLRPRIFQEFILQDYHSFHNFAVQNDGYKTLGILVPIPTVRRVEKLVYFFGDLPGGDLPGQIG